MACQRHVGEIKLPDGKRPKNEPGTAEHTSLSPIVKTIQILNLRNAHGQSARNIESAIRHTKINYAQSQHICIIGRLSSAAKQPNRAHGKGNCLYFWQGS